MPHRSITGCGVSVPHSLNYLVRRITIGNICPGSSGTKHPQNSVQNTAPILPWSSSPITTSCWFGNKLVQDFPLCVGDVSGNCGKHRTDTLQDVRCQNLFSNDALSAGGFAASGNALPLRKAIYGVHCLLPDKDTVCGLPPPCVNRLM